MGTPGHPEGVQHWSNKAMYSHKLEGHRKRQQGFWLFFKECCWQCEGGGFVENILTDVTAIKSETAYGGFRPDILLERVTSHPFGWRLPTPARRHQRSWPIARIMGLTFLNWMAANTLTIARSGKPISPLAIAANGNGSSFFTFGDTCQISTTP